MHFNIASQIKKDLNGCDFFSIDLDATTDITSSARLEVFAGYCSSDEIYEEQLNLEFLPSNTTGKNICDNLIDMLHEKNIDLSKIVSIITDGAHNMVGRHVGFINL